MSKELIPETQKFELMQREAKVFLESGFFRDVQNHAQAIVKVMAGKELGIGPFQAMSGLNVIEGKIVMNAGLISTLIANSPYHRYEIKEINEKTCRLEFYKKDDQGNEKLKGESSFTIEEAIRAGLANKNNWKNFPSDMLFARAITRGARRFTPEIFAGPVYVPEELGYNMNEDGLILDEDEDEEDQVDPLNREDESDCQWK